MSKTLMDKLQAAIQNDTDMSWLDKCVLQSFCEELAANEKKVLTQSASDDISEHYIVDHFSSRIAGLFMNYEIVTQEEVENFTDTVSIDDRTYSMFYDFACLYTTFVQSESISVLKQFLRDEICYRFTGAYPVLDDTVENKLLHLGKSSVINLFSTDNMYLCCIRTVLRKMTDNQLDELYYKVFNCRPHA